MECGKGMMRIGGGRDESRRTTNKQPGTGENKMSNNWRIEDNRRADRERAHKLSRLPANYCRRCTGTGRITILPAGGYWRTSCDACKGTGIG